MRRTHLDEIPQLWNVIRGEMTIVGPRPERPELIAELERSLPYYDRRHLVKPGIAGWAQARCGYGGSEEGTGWKLCHDLFYLKHRSVYFDLLILIENVRVSLQSGVQFNVRAPQEQFILGHAARVARDVARVVRRPRSRGRGICRCSGSAQSTRPRKRLVRSSRGLSSTSAGRALLDDHARRP